MDITAVFFVSDKLGVRILPGDCRAQAVSI